MEIKHVKVPITMSGKRKVQISLIFILLVYVSCPKFILALLFIMV